MPLLAAFIGALFGKFCDWLGSFLTKKAANYVAMSVTLAAAIAAVWVALSGVIAALISSVPPQVVIAVGWFAIPNLDQCIAARVGTEIALAGYRWHRETIRAAASTT